MRTIVSLFVGLVLFIAAPAHAAFHRWDFNEVYSNADGSVQFIELFTQFNGEQFTAGQTIKSTSGSTFLFPGNTPAPTGNHHLLLATPGFADLDGGVAPDFEISVNFFDPSGDTLTFAFLDDPSVTFSNLPTDGVGSLHYPFRDFINNGVAGVNSPANYLGISGSIVPAPMLPSDLTGNGFVDFEDLTVLLANWNKDVSAADGNLVDPAGTPVNFEDLTVLLAAWTGPAAGGSPQAALGAEAVPEPSSFLLAAFASLGVAVFLRRRGRSIRATR